MNPQFDHEQLRAYQDGLRFVAWVGVLLEELPSKLAARDQLDRASTSIVLNIAEGNGKRSPVDRCRYLDMARGSALECAACLDVLVARSKLEAERAQEGKAILGAVIPMIAGLIARFSRVVQEEPAIYADAAIHGENEND